MNKQEFEIIVRGLAPSVSSPVSEDLLREYKLRCEGVQASFIRLNSEFSKSRDTREYASDYIDSMIDKLRNLNELDSLKVYALTVEFDQTTPNFAFYDLVKIVNDSNIDRAVELVLSFDERIKEYFRSELSSFDALKIERELDEYQDQMIKGMQLLKKHAGKF